MAKRKGRVESREPSNGGKGFVLVDFDAIERGEYLSWAEGRSFDFSDVISQLCESGWKLSVSYSVYYACYYGSLTGKETGTKYDRYTLAVRHTDVNRLFGLLLFVGGVLCEDNRVNLPDSSNKFSW